MPDPVHHDRIIGGWRHRLDADGTLRIEIGRDFDTAIAVSRFPGPLAGLAGVTRVVIDISRPVRLGSSFFSGVLVLRDRLSGGKPEPIAVMVVGGNSHIVETAHLLGVDKVVRFAPREQP